MMVMKMKSRKKSGSLESLDEAGVELSPFRNSDSLPQMEMEI